MDEMSKREMDRMRADSDMHTLRRAEEIRSDKKRMAAMQKHMQQQMREMNKMMSRVKGE